MTSTSMRFLFALLPLFLFAVAAGAAETGMSPETITPQQIATLKKAKRDRLIDTIMATRQECAAQYAADSDPKVRECFQREVKIRIKDFIFAYRDAKNTCAQQNASSPEICALEAFLSGQPATQPRVTSPTSAFEKAKCPFVTTDKNIECGYVTVPEKHALPTGRTIRLAVAVLKSNSSQSAAEPVFYLEGGPGVGSLKIAAEWEKSPLRTRHDLVLFDQRGTGFSQPALSCPNFDKAYWKAINADNVSAMGQAEVAALLDCFASLEKQGHDLSAYNSAEGAQDIQAIRKALGYKQINLYGTSYGTRLALTAMRDTPEYIRSVALDSVLPLQENVFGKESDRVIGIFGKIFQTCREDASCSATYPTMEQDFYDLLGQLDKRPVQIEFQDQQNKSQKVSMSALQLYIAAYRLISTSEGISYFPAYIEAAKKGNLTPFAALFAATEGELSGMMEVGAHYATVCNEEYEETSAVSPSGPRNSLMDFVTKAEAESTYALLCRQWKYRQVPIIEYLPVKSDIPTLILAGDFDPITPVEWAAEAAKTLSESTRLTFPLAHGELTITEGCAAQIALDFFGDPAKTPTSACLGQIQKLEFVTNPAAEGESAYCYRKAEMGGDFLFRFRYPVIDETVAEKIGCYYGDFDNSGRMQGLHFVRFRNLTDSETDGYASTRIRYPKTGQEIHSYFAEDESKATDYWGAHSIAYERKGRTVTTKEYDMAGDLLTDENGVSASYHYEVGADGYRKSRFHLDKSGKRTPDADGVYEKRYSYDTSGNLVKLSNHDVQGNLTEDNRDGVSAVIFEYDAKGNEILRTHLGKNDKAKTLKEKGYAKIRSEYDLFGNETRREYLDALGKLVAYSSTDPVAIMTFKYNDIGQELEARYLGVDGKLVKDGDTGYALMRSDYDSHGRLIEQAEYDEQGKLQNNKESGIARITFKYAADHEMVEMRFLDKDGKLVNHRQMGFAVLKYQDENRLKLIFLDKEGKEVSPPQE